MSTFALDQIQSQLPDALVERFTDRSGGAWGIVKPARIAEVAKLAKEQLGFRLFVSMDGVDRLHLPPEQRSPRFEVLYFFKNVDRNEHLSLKVLVDEGQDLPTISSVYQGAAWSERLVWDFYGVRFTGHPNLKRMFMYESFEGHPLRKDYPLRGRQPLVPERSIKDIFRGPGTNSPVD